ncbi:MAG: hypothetical protein QXM16_01395 [Nitrososphaerota archaeon]
MARIVCGERGSMRIKLPITVWRSLKIPDKGDYIGIVRGERLE